MIICNGAVGLCLLAGGIKHHEQTFRLEGATSALAALIALATLSLVLPTFTTSAPARIHRLQLAFAAIASLALWGVFVFVQTVRHRDYFLPPARRRRIAARAAAGNAAAWASFGLMLVALVPSSAWPRCCRRRWSAASRRQARRRP
jgi:Ca2+:H+ antiporter